MYCYLIIIISLEGINYNNFSFLGEDPWLSFIRLRDYVST